MGYPRWMYRIVWAMLFFQIVLLFGPTEAFHVPLFNQSGAGVSADLMSSLLAQDSAACDTHFNNFFKLIKEEKEIFYADPDIGYYGYCHEAFLAFLQTTLMVQGLIWMATVVVAAPVFLPDVGDSSSVTKIMPAALPESKVESKVVFEEAPAAARRQEEDERKKKAEEETKKAEQEKKKAEEEANKAVEVGEKVEDVEEQAPAPPTQAVADAAEQQAAEAAEAKVEAPAASETIATADAEAVAAAEVDKAE